MIALWMAYAAALAALLAGAAACADRVLRLTRRASRAAWALAMATSLALPAAGLIVAERTPASAPAAVRGANGGDALSALLSRARVVELTATPATQLPALDRPLLALWVAASLAAFGWLLLSRRRLRAALAAWRAETVRGEPVLVSPDVGPAVVGVRGGRIVLPTWALGLDDRALALMLAHERAHLAARDPQLLAAGAVAAALMPWNPALWWQLRRLRLAVEIDCDRRVLATHPDVASYGALLLDVARREAPRNFARSLPAAALSSATTSLERRIQTMTMRSPRRRTLQTLGLTTLGTALVVAACEAPHPTGLKPQSKVPLTSIKSAPASMRSDVTEAQVRSAVADRLPELMRATGKRQHVWFVQDANGQIVKAMRDTAGAPMQGALAKAGLASLDANAIATVDIMKLAAGRVAADSVDVVWVRLKGANETGGNTEYRVTGAPMSRSAIATVSPAEGSPAKATFGPVTVRMHTDTVAGVKMKGSGPTPLYIIDGQEQADGETAAKALSPDRIDSVEVLKGAAAIAKYGDKAANGVILITTKH